jgi:hypothetical protein
MKTKRAELAKTLYLSILGSLGILMGAGLLSDSPLGHKQFFYELGITAFFTAGALATALCFVMHKDGTLKW